MHKEWEVEKINEKGEIYKCIENKKITTKNWMYTQKKENKDGKKAS